jgi:hypothetical protein
MRTAYEKGYDVITLTDCTACSSSAAQAAAAGPDGTFGMFSTQKTAEEFTAMLAAGNGDAEAKVAATAAIVEDEKNNKSKPVFHYWAKVASRGHYLFYTLAFHDRLDDVEHKGDQPYPGAEGWDAVLRSKVGSLPVLVDGDVSLGQSRAIFAYLCRKFGIGQDLSLADFAASEELVDTAIDVHSKLSTAQYAPDRTAAMDALFADGGGVPKILAGFEDYVGGTVTPGHCCFAAA